MQQSKQLGTEKISKLLLKFSLPAVIGMLVNATYNVVDRIFVGNGVGDLALAGITVEFPISLLVMACTMLIGVGASTLISIRLGENKEEEAENIMGNAMVMMLFAAVLITLFGLLFLKPLVAAIGGRNPEVMPYALDYAGIILAGTVFFMFGMGANNFIRAEGNPRTAMTTMLIGAVINIILDPIFIYVLKWGIKGAAIATVIAKAVSALWVLFYFLSGKGQLKLNPAKIRMRSRYVLNILSIGTAPFAMQLAASLLNVILNNSLNAYGGELALAAMGIVGSISTLLMMPIFGINQGLQPIIGYNYGARQYNRVKEALFKGMAGATLISLLGFLLVNIFPTQLVAFFNKENPALIELGRRSLRIFLLAMPIVGAQVVGASYFQAVGKPKQAAFLSLSRQVLILIPSILILPRFFGLNGIYYAGPLSDLSSAILTGIWIALELQKLGDDKAGLVES
ncbi:MAG: MATE family efflux transporter [Bacillota bacterium]|jgi:putative MATE family efflux protein|nr:MATE family efflux transporter [Bacillota bacterium]HHU29226.1 MATE family efflux transporter [Bacillota bacterium]